MSKKDDARRNYRREIYKRNREEFFQGKGCASCGSFDRLNLDHIDPKKKTTHRIWHWGKERRESELIKCQILCHPCHRKKTNEDFGWGEHGASMYSKGACRCDICRTAGSARKQAWRLRKRSP